MDIRDDVRAAHRAGAWDVLRAIGVVFDLEPDHACLARSWRDRMWSDPKTFDQFVQTEQQKREEQ